MLAAIFYATYDLRLFEHGWRVAPSAWSTKITAQAALSVLAAVAAWSSVGPQLTSSTATVAVATAAIWSGVFVNALASVLRVGRRQAVGRRGRRSCTQPRVDPILSLIFSARPSASGPVGGALFIAACFPARRRPSPIEPRLRT